MDLLDRLGLRTAMTLTSGSPEVVVALIDGPVHLKHPALDGANIRLLSSPAGAACRAGGLACAHGTFVAGILSAARGAPAPAICPGCTLLVRPIFQDFDGSFLPAASPADLADAIVECANAGARILNLSAAITPASAASQRALHSALAHAAGRGALVVAASGNDAAIGGSSLTQHPAVIPVVAYGVDGVPMRDSTIGIGIGRRGIGAYGEGIGSLGPTPPRRNITGTSVAAPLVAGAAALLWTLFPTATASDIRLAIVHSVPRPRRGLAPPMLDVRTAMNFLSH
jgi:subtilisin family serine protease